MSDVRDDNVMQSNSLLHYGRAQNDFSSYGACADEYRQQVNSLQWNLEVVALKQTGYDKFSEAGYVRGLEFVSKDAPLDEDDRVWTQFHLFQ